MVRVLVLNLCSLSDFMVFLMLLANQTLIEAISSILLGYIMVVFITTNSTDTNLSFRKE